MLHERREGFMKRPHIHPESNIYNNCIEVTIKNRWYHKAVIHYTLDGTTPTLASPRYHHPFLICDDTVVKAVAFHAGRRSEVAERVYGFKHPYYPEHVARGLDDITWS